MIEWFARNSVAANLLMVSIILVGLSSASRSIPLEVFPSFEIEAVSIITPFRGATPESVEEGITNRIEESIYTIEGIKEVTSQSSEGVSQVIAEVSEGFDKREILNEIKLKVDSLNSLPQEAENPIVALSTYNEAVMQVAVTGTVDAKSLRISADKVRDKLLAHPSITLVELQGVNNYEVAIEVNPETLDDYNLSLAQIAQAIRRGSLDSSAGNIKTRDGDILVRTDGQAYSAREFAQIPVLTKLGGDPILLGEIANIEDGFEEQPLRTRFNDTPAIMMEVLRTGEQSAIEIADIVKAQIEEFNSRSTNGVTLYYWDDDSKILKGRLSTLLSSGLYGGLLVLLILSLFLRPAIAFWVFLGVPVSFMGAFIFMPLVGGTFNMISLFAFITVLGIVVDDAIVTGENIYTKMREGLPPIDAAVTGTKEIALPVTFGILTTIVAFLPMTDMGANRIGFLTLQIPIVVIPVLVFSLIESKLVLPAHLSHIRPRPEGADLNILSRLQMKVARGLEVFIEAKFAPFLNNCLSNKAITITVLLSISTLIVTWSATGHLRFTFFPRVESEEIKVFLVMPDTTGFATTEQHIQNISDEVLNLKEKYADPETGTSIIRHTYSTVGSSQGAIKPSVGQVRIELLGPEERHIDIRAFEIARELMDNIGEIPGSEQLSIVAELAEGGKPVFVELTGASIEQMQRIGNTVREQLKQYPDVFDIQDNYSGGKEELNIALTPRAHALGLSLADVGTQVRASIFGLEAQRIQRGREEVRVMVRLPAEYRSSIESLKSLPIHVGQENQPVPLSDLATITPVSSPTTLFRVNRSPIITVTADVDKDRADVGLVLDDLRALLEQASLVEPTLKYAFKGEAEEQAENNEGFKSGGILVLIAIYALLAIPFKSYAQPLIVMSVIPFAMVGAVLGHIITGYDFSMLSAVGMMALLGVVINDSLVLVDYINKQRAKGLEVWDAVLKSGSARFRPVLLTSVTTFAGLTPLLLDNSTQSEFLKQMAISLGFGIVFATLITLVIVPVNYLLGYQIKHWCIDYWNREDVRV